MGICIDPIPVKLNNLPLGKYFDCEFYYRNAGSDALILLCEKLILTEALIRRLRKAIFPEESLLISRDSVIRVFFNQGYELGFTKDEVQAILDNLNPWDDAYMARHFSGSHYIPADILAAENADKDEKEEDLPVETIKDESYAKTFYYQKALKKYKNQKETTKKLMSDVVEKGTVDTVESGNIIKKIQQQLVTNDTPIIIQTINQIIRSDDEYLHIHSLNVAYLNGLMGKWLNFDPIKQSEIVETGLLHDVGKLKVDQTVLNKPAKLTQEEFEEIKKHPEFSRQTLVKSGITNIKILDGVLQHHEKVNGTGYPLGLDGQTISEYAKITAVSDIYDAMVTKRVYKAPHSPFVILNEFQKGAYSELDFSYVDVFINCMTDDLKGEKIIMSDGSTAFIKLVNPRKLLYPIVERDDGEIITTDEDYYCVRLCV